MTPPAPAGPVPYTPDVEVLQDDEAEVHRELAETMLGMARTMADHTGRAARSVHAKSHGLLRGELRVLDGLPPAMAQGLFATPGVHSAVLRISTPPTEMLDDRVSLPRGMAIKVLGVAGERVEASEGATTQDFLFVDGPVFGAPDAKGFLKKLKLLAVTTDKAPRSKRVLSNVLQGVEKALEAVGGKSGTLIAMGGHPELHPLGATFFTQVPVRYGQFIAKFQLVPVSSELTALVGQPLDLDDKPDGMRDAVVAFFGRPSAPPAEWELRAQLCTDLEKMPIEDASVEWPQNLSPFVAVARLTVAPQPAWTEALVREIDEGMAFDPWHALAAHRPLGGVMRARRVAYAASAQFRGERNGCPVHEPRAQSVPMT